MRETMTTIGEVAAFCAITAGLIVGLGVIAGSLIAGGTLIGIISFAVGDE